MAGLDYLQAFHLTCDVKNFRRVRYRDTNDYVEVKGEKGWHMLFSCGECLDEFFVLFVPTKQRNHIHIAMDKMLEQMKDLQDQFDEETAAKTKAFEEYYWGEWCKTKPMRSA